MSACFHVWPCSYYCWSIGLVFVKFISEFLGTDFIWYCGRIIVYISALFALKVSEARILWDICLNAMK